MTCEKCPSDKPAPEPAPDHNQPLVRRVLQMCTRFLPEGSALLSSSCCWLPTVLDFLFAGSVTAAGVEYLRNALLATSIVGLVWGVRREGFSRRMVWRIVICFGLLAWAQYNRRTQVVRPGSHSCH
ncbi:uncharacterized protein N7473_012825 [Penicillium subrubescens]|uniref:uncharacterized protein n=1 Tax=Penicillium subrubescens TaxID=1316194 RepID=UPI002544E37A|nr:uncharacterized protein N7473_012825 [Penicillium subrubescens]KAJ5875478.1 hypothetical protein N7473_012825 [Penicillium subrubescens]